MKTTLWLVVVVVLVFSSVVAVLAQDDNPCGNYFYHKIESPQDGVYVSGDSEVRIDVRDTSSGQVFDYRSNLRVKSVAVLGGPDYNTYTFGDASFREDGLHALKSPDSGKYFDLSHIIFCYTYGDDDSEDGGTPWTPTGEPTENSTIVPTSTPEPTLPPIITNTPTNTPLPTIVVITPVPSATVTLVAPPEEDNYYYLPIIICQGDWSPLNFCIDQPYY